MAKNYITKLTTCLHIGYGILYIIYSLRAIVYIVQFLRGEYLHNDKKNQILSRRNNGYS